MPVGRDGAPDLKCAQHDHPPVSGCWLRYLSSTQTNLSIEKAQFPVGLAQTTAQAQAQIFKELDFDDGM